MAATISRVFGAGKVTAISALAGAVTAAACCRACLLSWSAERAGLSVWSRETVVGVTRENGAGALADVSGAIDGNGLLPILF